MGSLHCEVVGVHFKSPRVHLRCERDGALCADCGLPMGNLRCEVMGMHLKSTGPSPYASSILFTKHQQFSVNEL